MPTIEPSRDQFAAFLRGDEDEPLTMLNLLRYRDTADYAGREDLAPDEEHWDTVLLVRYPSRRAFLEMQRLPHYQAAVGHRSAALADSRLVPVAAA